MVKVGAAQLGPIQRSDNRKSVVQRLLELLREAHGMGCDVVVFPELALTTFFARWYMEDQAEVDSFCESEMPGPATRPLFEEAARLGIGFYLGYAELTQEEGRTRHFNTSIIVDKTGACFRQAQALRGTSRYHLRRRDSRGATDPLGRIGPFCRTVVERGFRGLAQGARSPRGRRKLRGADYRHRFEGHQVRGTRPRTEHMKASQ